MTEFKFPEKYHGLLGLSSVIPTPNSIAHKIDSDFVTVDALVAYSNGVQTVRLRASTEEEVATVRDAYIGWEVNQDNIDNIHVAKYRAKIRATNGMGSFKSYWASDRLTKLAKAAKAK